MSDTAPAPATVRDFVYLDAHRLHSLYSQIFKGVPEQIIHSYAGERASKETASDVVGKGARMDVQVAEATLKTENKVLLDYMYSHLEEHISDRILPIDTTTKSTASLSAGKLVRIAGRAKFLDYKRLTEFTQKFNRLAEVIASASIQQMAPEIAAVREQHAQIKDRNQRKVAEAQLKDLTDPAKFAKKMGLAQDESLMENIRFIVDLMYPGGFDVLVTPGTNDPLVAFRGILDQNWLRLEPSKLNAAYSGETEEDMVMVGQICRTSSLPATQAVPLTGNATISDHLQQLFNALAEFQAKFDEAGPARQVVTVLPLAVYSELSIPSK